MRVAGLSHPWGFLLFSPTSDTEMVRMAADHAVRRLQAGQSHLALSDFCGTNLAITAVLATLFVRTASWRGGSFSRSVVAACAALVLAQPAAHTVQRSVTTLADVRDRSAGQARRLGGWSTGTIHHVRIS